MVTSAQRIQFLVSHEEGFGRSRLPALYSDFRGMRAHNPEGYAANVAAWRRALASLVRWGLLPSASGPAKATSAKAAAAGAGTSAGAARNLLILSAGPQLLDALHSDRYGSPDALDAVLYEAVQGHDLAPLPAFLTAQESIYSRNGSWAAWAASIPWAVLSWGLQQLVGAGSGTPGKIPAQQYVVLANTEAAAAAFAERTADLRGRFERTWSVAQFKRAFGQPGAVFNDGGGEDELDVVDGAALRLSDADLDVLLVFLSRDKGLVAYDGQVVTLLHGSGSGDATRRPAGITDEDRAVAQLRELLESLTHQTDVLSARVDELAAAARDAAVVRKNRVAALAALGKKKQAEAALAKRYETLAQLEATASKIEQAADHVQIVQAIAASGNALRMLNARAGGVEAVEDVVDRLRSQMDATDEIGRILAEDAVAGGMAGALDEAEIDEELAALEGQQQDKTRAEAAAAVRQKEMEAAEETRRRLAAIESVPDALEAALEEETTRSLKELTLN